MSNALAFNSTAIRQTEDRLNLTDMWRAAGADPARKPAHWLRSDTARDFIAFIAGNLKVAESQLCEVTQGAPETGGGTWAHWQVGMAYAKYLSPEFHVWCNEVVRAHMEGRPAPPSLALPPSLTDALATIAQQSVTLGAMAARHEHAIAVVGDKVERLEGRFEHIDHEVKHIRRAIEGRRVEISNRVKRVHRQTIVEHGGLCPCCGKAKILETVNGNALMQCEYDHFFARNRAQLHETWLVCKPCHDRISCDPRGHENVELQFKTHQLRVSQTESPQLRLIRGDGGTP